MTLRNQAILITGGASGLGLATARAAVEAGAYVTVADLPRDDMAKVLAALGDNVQFVVADVTDAAAVLAAAEKAAEPAALRSVVHTAGRGGPVRFIDRDGKPGDSLLFERVVRTNLVGTFNVIGATASVMARNEVVEGERGSIVLTGSVAAFEGQIGQTGYAASKAGVVGLTLVAARDLASKGIRVNCVAPGIMDTPMLGRVAGEARRRLEDTVTFPKRLGHPDEFASLAVALLENRYLNGETIRLDGAIRMAPR
ncbi:SDR family NAD(P)-dependent oxidoreductase [Nocardia fusca]|uniref:SDR family NAD(P)-dependent oxidoreductase n=1 Tax=Nocardia fusca TaxID=941183 RepID=UPI0007A766D2|nr:SDR family NAD(P)-dependent oxidoreductase [Nocardia fusca]